MVHKYLTSEGARNLHTFKYRGGDQSILYVTILSPLAEAVSAQMPDWVSANLISFAGHLFLMTGYILCLAFCGSSLSCTPPAWALWTALALQVAWLIFDNVDGKQARRLGLSSPLGLLFDHQVDALCLFSTATLVSIVSGFGDSPFALGCWTAMMVPFFFSTWEEYHTGKLEFPTYTGPSEGVVLLCSYMAFMIYHTPSPGFVLAGLPFSHAVFWALGLLAVLNAVVSVLRVSANGEKAVITILPFAYLTLAVASALWVSPAHLGTAAAREMILFLGFVFAQEMARMQVAHVTSTSYSPLCLPNFVQLTAFIGNTWAHFCGCLPYRYGLVDEYQLLLLLSAASVLCYFYMAYITSHEIAQELGIPILQVPKRRTVNK